MPVRFEAVRYALACNAIDQIKSRVNVQKELNKDTNRNDERKLMCEENTF